MSEQQDSPPNHLPLILEKMVAYAAKQGYFKTSQEEETRRQMYAEFVLDEMRDTPVRDVSVNKGVAVVTLLDHENLLAAIRHMKAHHLIERARDYPPGFDLETKLVGAYRLGVEEREGYLRGRISTTIHPEPNTIVEFLIR